MARIFKQNLKGLKSLDKGIKTLERTIIKTLGHSSSLVVIKKNQRNPIFTKSGFIIAKELELDNAFENMGVKLVRDAAEKVAILSGSGFSTTIILSSALISRGVEGLSNGLDTNQIRSGIMKARDLLEKELERAVVIPHQQEDVFNIALNASNNDVAISSLITEAISKIGLDSDIVVKDSFNQTDRMDITTGFNLNIGFASPYFVNNPQNMSLELDNVHIVIFDHKLSCFNNDFISFLEKIVIDSKIPLVLFADDFDKDILDTLIINKIKGGLPVCAICTQSLGRKKKALLEDIALISGAKIISPEMKHVLTEDESDFIGYARHIKISHEATLIMMDDHRRSYLNPEIQNIKNLLMQTTLTEERKSLLDRLTRLQGTKAVIYLKSQNEQEYNLRKTLTEHAVTNVRSSLASGCVVGGGVALARASLCLENEKGSSDGENFGIYLMKEVVKHPLKHLLDNNDVYSELVMDKILKHQDYDFGYNITKHSFENLKTSGILDSLATVKLCLRQAVSTASLLLGCSLFISNQLVPFKKM